MQQDNKTMLGVWFKPSENYFLVLLKCESWEKLRELQIKYKTMYTQLISKIDDMEKEMEVDSQNF